MALNLQRSNPILENLEAPRSRFMLVMSYDGAPFNGWQIQPNSPSVQQAVETALRTALRIPLHIVGAGRTDTGVNARHIVAHFDVPETVGSTLDTRQLKHTLNALLRPSVIVHHIVGVDNDAHARFDATARTYRYYLHTAEDPFRAGRSRYFYQKLDFDSMNREAAELIGHQDFTSFSKLHTDTDNNFCEVKHAQWHRYGPGHYYFEITANRFLRNMVRAVVGTLLDIGTGRATQGHMRRVIDAKDRCKAGTSVPGYALYLWNIEYPYPLPGVPLPDNI